MVRIRITARERILLEESLKYNSNSLRKLQLNIEDNNVIIEEDIINILDEIIDCISNYFCAKGLQEDDEPNSLGFELEDLNTKFIRKLQELNS